MWKVSKSGMIVEFKRWILITLCYFAPRIIRRKAIFWLRRFPTYPEELGCFRTDVAFAALGLLRAGDIQLFEDQVAAYPFAERWNGLNSRIQVAHLRSHGGWRVFTSFANNKIGKSSLPYIERGGSY
ncbi:MAG TPA: hypothetical protein VJJ80_01110 [Patescibacteria group bacterium]|nr:hypothetical protein [Patescibacteria group bacterium]